jgi:nucleoid-associated protein YgaU
MSKFAGMGAGPVIGAGAALVAAAVALGVYLSGGDPSGPAPEVPEAQAPVAPETTANAPAAPQGAEEAAPEQAAPPPAAPAAPKSAVAPAPEQDSAQDTAQEQAVPPPDPPALDTFRLDPGGQMLVAGRAVPGGRVAVTVDDARLGTTEADGAGKFVAFLDLPPSDAVRVLGLELLLEDGRVIRSPDEVLIAPTPVPDPQPEAVAEAVAQPEAEAEAEAEAETGGGASQGVAADVPDPAAPELATSAPAAPEAPATAPDTVPPAEAGTAVAQPAPTTPAPSAPTVLLSDASGVRVLQAPAGPGPQVMSQVALDAISYSEAGEVQLAGRASNADARVRIYLDNRAITTAPVDASGAWRSALPEVDTGIYTLRVDEVDAGGAVVSRVETPFKREDVAILAPQDSPQGGTTDGPPRPPRMSVVTVQPGSTLWAISREAYGEGVLYVRVFEANRDRIRDPDLIYPGQVFELPQ